jgi:hypothetical protein
MTMHGSVIAIGAGSQRWISVQSVSYCVLFCVNVKSLAFGILHGCLCMNAIRAHLACRLPDNGQWPGKPVSTAPLSVRVHASGLWSWV